MAVLYQAKSGTWTSSATATTSPAWPTHTTGDIALLFIEAAGGDTISLTNAQGFQAVTGSPWKTGTGTAGTQLAVYWHRATSGSMTAPTVADAGDHHYAGIVTFRGGIASGDPIDAISGGTKASASTTATLNSVTTNVANCLIVYAITKDLDATAAFTTSITNSNLSSITERHDAGATAGGGGGIAVVTGEYVGPGSIGTASWSGTSSINAFVTIALKPAITWTGYSQCPGFIM